MISLAVIFDFATKLGSGVGVVKLEVVVVDGAQSLITSISSYALLVQTAFENSTSLFVALII